jgi:hypothetical protein
MIDAQALIGRISKLLTDEGFDFWDKSFIANSINEAVRHILRYRNDANIKKFDVNGSNPIALDTKTVALITTDGLLVDGILTKPLSVKTKKQISDIDPNWMSDCDYQTDTVVYDIETPQELWAYPKLKTNESIRVVLSVLPDDIDDTSTNLDFSKLYEGDIINYCLYRAYQREGTQGRKEQFYHTQFLNSLGVKTESDKYFEAKREGK